MNKCSNSLTRRPANWWGSAKWSPNFGVKKQNEALESQFPKQHTCLRFGEPLSRNRHPNMTQSEQVFAICYASEVADDAISGGHVKTVDGHTVLNFEVASFVSFRYIQTRSPPIDGEAKRRATGIRPKDV